VTTFAAVLLLVTAIWSFLVWPAFLRRVLRDPRARDEAGKATKFLTVHVVLVSISLLLAAACAVTGIMLLISGA